MKDDYKIADAFAHQLLPQLCFVQTSQFFPNLWNTPGDQYANMLWERLANMLGARDYTRKIKGSKKDPKEGLTIFLIEFPRLDGKEVPVRAAGIFEYRRSGVSFAVITVECYTLERHNGRYLCQKWEDSPNQYICTRQQEISNESEKLFIEIITKMSKKNSGSASPDSSEAIYNHWKARIPQEVEKEIRLSFGKASATLSLVLDEIAREYPKVSALVQSLKINSQDEFFKIGIISFAVGHNNRNVINQKMLSATTVNELPAELSITLNQATDKFGALLGSLYEELKSKGVMIRRPWHEKILESFGFVKEAQLACMQNGFRTVIIG